MPQRYEALRQEIVEQIEADRAAGTFGRLAFLDENALRRRPEWDRHTLLRPAFVRDCEKILHLPPYNRTNGKTQVFSFYQNDDLTRRGLHVQVVSRIARNVGRLLGLNLDLIEAIALGHDLGHTPFGHAGERLLDRLLCQRAGCRFFHHAQSVRVLETLYRRNVSLQVLDGILCHNGELEQQRYEPAGELTFADFDDRLAATLAGREVTLTPATLEGCVVRLCDMIAYLGKDRQDALTARILPDLTCFTDSEIGLHNAVMINNLVVDVVNQSYGKNAIILSPAVFESLRQAKRENYANIYHNADLEAAYEQTIAPMFTELYDRLLADLLAEDESSPIFRHHLAHLRQATRPYEEDFAYRRENPHRMVADYLASMTDSYFIALHRRLFPNSPHHIALHSYFEDLEEE